MKNRVSTIINPIDVSVFNCSKSRTPVEGRIMFAGRVHPAKGLMCLADACGRSFAMGRVRELFLIGAWKESEGGGGDIFANEIKKTASPCPVILHGAVRSPAELAEIERTASVFVYPSEDAIGEACPVAPMEAMALGIPTVVSDLKCYDDYVVEGVNALKFKTGDVNDLTEKIISLCDDSSLSTHIGENAKQITQRFSASAVSHRYVGLFKDVLE